MLILGQEGKGLRLVRRRDVRGSIKPSPLHTHTYTHTHTHVRTHSPSSIHHCASTSVCCMYESSIVGS